jgi:hypothetical protein
MRINPRGPGNGESPMDIPPRMPQSGCASAASVGLIQLTEGLVVMSAMATRFAANVSIVITTMVGTNFFKRNFLLAVSQFLLPGKRRGR